MSDTTFTPKQHEYLDEHADEYPDDVVEDARRRLDEWVQTQESVGKRPNICAAAAVYAAFVDLGYPVSTRPTQDAIVAEFGTTRGSLGKRLTDDAFPGKSPREIDDE